MAYRITTCLCQMRSRTITETVGSVDCCSFLVYGLVFGRYLSRWVVIISVSSSVCVCVRVVVLLCASECQISSCVRTGLMTSFQSCTMRRRDSRRTRTSGQWKPAWTTARTTRFTWWTAASATSWCSRASLPPRFMYPSSPCLVRLVMLLFRRPFPSSSLVQKLSSHNIIRYRWLCRLNATDCSLPKPSTFAWFLFRLRNRFSTDTAITSALITTVGVVIV